MKDKLYEQINLKKSSAPFFTRVDLKVNNKNNNGDRIIVVICVCWLVFETKQFK